MTEGIFEDLLYKKIQIACKSNAVWLLLHAIIKEMVNNDCRHVYKTEVKAFNVGCMKPWINYEPRTLEEIISFWR